MCVSRISARYHSTSNSCQALTSHEPNCCVVKNNFYSLSVNFQLVRASQLSRAGYSILGKQYIFTSFSLTLPLFSLSLSLSHHPSLHCLSQRTPNCRRAASAASSSIISSDAAPAADEVAGAEEEGAAAESWRKATSFTSLCPRFLSGDRYRHTHAQEQSGGAIISH